jgi:hypothetical protein
MLKLIRNYINPNGFAVRGLVIFTKSRFQGLKVAYLIKKGISDFKFKQFEHAQVKVERARGVGRKLCIRDNTDSLKMIFTKGSGGKKGRLLRSCFFGKKGNDSIKTELR